MFFFLPLIPIIAVKIGKVNHPSGKKYLSLQCIYMPLFGDHCSEDGNSRHIICVQLTLVLCIHVEVNTVRLSEQIDILAKQLCLFMTS